MDIAELMYVGVFKVDRGIVVEGIALVVEGLKEVRGIVRALV